MKIYICIYIEEGRYHGQDRSLEEGAGGEGLVTVQEDVENSRDTLETVQPYFSYQILCFFVCLFVFSVLKLRSCFVSVS